MHWRPFWNLFVWGPAAPRIFQHVGRFTRPKDPADADYERQSGGSTALLHLLKHAA